MDQLPSELIVSILLYLQLEVLLRTVSRVCKHLYRIICENSILWRYFEFDHQIQLNRHTLENTLRRVECFRAFCIPEAIIDLPAPDTDLLLYKLVNAKNIVWLDLSSSHLSSLCFLHGLHTLEVLILDSCPNISGCDFEIIASCHKLEQLYVGFTSVAPSTISALLPHRVHTLECSGIGFSTSEARNLLRRYHQQLQFFSLSLDPFPSDDTLNTLKSDYSDTTIFIVSL